jgi:hypothetical protein
MIAIYRYQDIQRQLADSFEHRYKRKDVNITGILLARPELEETQKEILPHLNYWHYRSDYYTEFFCIGYTPKKPRDDREAKEVVTIGGEKWYFSPKAFSDVVDHLESQTKWKYDSQCYLIITNSRYDRDRKKASLDFRGGMVVNIGQAVKDEAIHSASQLADYLFQFAKRINEDSKDPVWDFSDSMGLRVVKRSLKDYFLALLPIQLSKSTKQAIHFVTRDLHSPERA